MTADQANLLRRTYVKQGDRRFTGEALTGFGPLGEDDSLVARIEAIWNLRPTAIEVRVGYAHPDDDSLTEWSKTTMTRAQAAQALRTARKSRLLIERSRIGYCISGQTNPAWSYA